jgi:sugar-specific transcriptional regulator TrmB
MSVLEILQTSGMTKAEAKIYLSLTKSGAARAGKIIQNTGLQSSVVHNALNKLLEKGFIAFVLEGSIREYHALDPSVIEEHMESKRLDFHKIIPNLKKLRKQREFTTAEVYRGYKGILSAMMFMAKDAKKGERYKYFAASDFFLSEISIDFFLKADLIRKDKGISLKGIASSKSKKLQVYKGSEIRYTQQSIPPAMNIFRDRVLLINLTHKPTGILICSEEIAHQYHEMWDAIWKSSTKR